MQIEYSFVQTDSHKSKSWLGGYQLPLTGDGSLPATLLLLDVFDLSVLCHFNGTKAYAQMIQPISLLGPYKNHAQPATCQYCMCYAWSFTEAA